MEKIKNNDFLLPLEDVYYFHKHGYLGAYSLGFTSEEINNIKRHFYENIITTESKWSNNYNQGRHLDNKVIFDLCSHPAIVRRITSIIGPNLILWQSNIFLKNPGDKAYPWHQDINYWGEIEPALSISAWIALDPANTENGCVQIIPGSHKKVIPHIKTEESQYDVKFGNQMADPLKFDSSKSVNMILNPGEFFLFNERTLHSSNENKSSNPRLGITVRITIPIVKINRNSPCILLQGEDYMGFNQLNNPPD